MKKDLTKCFVALLQGELLYQTIDPMQICKCNGILGISGMATGPTPDRLALSNLL
jgi:hypothetical protein